MQPHMSLGGLSAVQVIQQAFNPAVCVLVSPDVDLLLAEIGSPGSRSLFTS